MNSKVKKYMRIMELIKKIFFSLPSIIFFVVIFVLEFILIFPGDFHNISFWDVIFSHFGIILFLGVMYILYVPLFIYFLFSRLLKKKSTRICIISVAFFLLSLFFHFYFFLLIYRIRNGITFDFLYFWYNRDIALLTLFRTYPIALSMLFLSFFVLPIFWFLQGKYFCSSYIDTAFRNNKRIFTLFFLMILATLLVSFFFPSLAYGEIIKFIDKSVFHKDTIKHFYYTHFLDYLKKTAQEPLSFSPLLQSRLSGNTIFFLEVESLSSFIASPHVTPNLYSAAMDGVFFPFFYTNSVQTIRGQESVLCGIPPTIGPTLIDSGIKNTLEKYPCLPRLLKKLGYKTFFFKSDRLGFSDTDKFMNAIGFDELHSEDIMKPQDPRNKWGYREDIFFSRIFDYLESYRDEKIFVFIAISSTNHWPFTVYDEKYKEKLPYKNPSSFKEKLSNSSFIQDAYFGDFYENYKKQYGKSSLLFATSDQAWPIGIHANNIYNEFGAYEENFLMPFLFIPPQEDLQYKRNTTVNDRYSQYDVLPTILQLLGIEYSYTFFGESFEPHLKKGGVEKSASGKLTLQPFNGGFISVVRYPQKYLFRISENTLEEFNLLSDPLEKNPTVRISAHNFISLITDLFPL